MMLDRRGIGLGAALVKTDWAWAAGKKSRAAAASNAQTNIRQNRSRRIDFI
jgi:hypothetical protein